MVIHTEPKIIHCTFCLDPRFESYISDGIEPCYYLTGNGFGFVHLWQHVMKFLPNISPINERSAQEKEYLAIADRIYYDLKANQTYDEPDVTDPMTRVMISDKKTRKQLELEKEMRRDMKRLEDWF